MEAQRHVAAVVEARRRVLLVEEHTEVGVRLNQPTGRVGTPANPSWTPCGGNPGETGYH